MVISKLIELLEQAKDQHGDVHVLLEDEPDYTVDKITLDKDTEHVLLHWDEPDTSIIGCCDHGDCRSSKWRWSMSGLLMYNDAYLVCRECFEEDFELGLYAENVYGYKQDENGEYTVRDYVYKNGMPIEVFNEINGIK